MRIKSDQCDYDMEYGAFGDSVPCGASTTKCEHCLTDAAVCESHLFECKSCTFKGCYDCVETHEESCGKHQPIINALDNPCAALEVA